MILCKSVLIFVNALVQVTAIRVNHHCAMFDSLELAYALIVNAYGRLTQW